MSMAKQLERRAAELHSGGFEAVLPAWRSLSAIWGRQVVARGPRGEEVVLAVDIDRDGALIVRTEQGIQRRHAAGELEVIPPCS